jgi:hypothetical protein
MKNRLFITVYDQSEKPFSRTIDGLRSCSRETISSLPKHIYCNFDQRTKAPEQSFPDFQSFLLFLLPPPAQGCQIFLGKTYQNVKNIPNNLKIYHCKTLQKYTQIGILGLKMCNLATLLHPRFTFWANFRHLGDYLLWPVLFGNFLFLSFFFHTKCYVSHKLTKYGFGYILGDFLQ